MIWLTAIACFQSAQKEAEKEEAIEEEMDAVVPEMRRHDVQAAAIRNAVVKGDLATAKQVATDFSARLPLSGLPDRLSPHNQALKSAVQSIASSEALPAATQGIGQMARACGDCHSDVGMSAPNPVGDMPGGDSFEAQMARHLWAAEQMWDGLVWRKSDRFEQAVAAWNDLPLVPPDKRTESKLGGELIALEDKLHTLAEKAASEPDQRIEHYTNMLQTCAACHALAR